MRLSASFARASTRILPLLIALCAAAPVQADDLTDDGIVLVVNKGPAAGEATLIWAGSIPNYDVFRSITRTNVTDPANKLYVTGAHQFQDATLPIPGSALYYVVTSVGPCAPLTPAPICTGLERCYPTTDQLTSCAGPVGVGGQCSLCTTDGQCSPTTVCIGSGGSGRCQKWCRIGFSTDCTLPSICLPLAQPLYAGGQQYGVCACP